MLGFENSLVEYTTTANRAADINQGFYALYVYSDLVQPQVVGDSLVPLLRAVPVKGKDGDYIHHNYVAPMYLPLQRNYFSTVEINIRDDTGQPVSFETGKVIVTVHIRRCRNF